MTKNEMQILILLLTDLKEQEKEKGEGCERDVAALPSSNLRDRIKAWGQRHIKCAKDSESIIEVLNHYILNNIYAERKVK